MADLKGLEILPITNDYWFVRTNGGEYFDTFLKHGFIAIGWNQVTFEDMKKTRVEVKKKIARIENLDVANKYESAEVTRIYNKILRFRDMRKEDVIVMPSSGSSRFAFGIASTDKGFEVESNVFDCPYQKRRRVKWIKTLSFSELDNVFYKIRRPQHALSKINEFSGYIDSVMYDVFQKDEFSHFVVRVQLDQSIPLRTLADTLQDIFHLMSEVNRDFGLNEDVDDSSIKITLQSPGYFNLKQRGVALVFVAMLLGATGCNDAKGNLDPQVRQRVDTFAVDHQQELDTLRNKLQHMHVNM